MKSFLVISVLASVALAQNSASSLIPTGISQGCSQFLTTLNNDASLASCTGPIISATSQVLAGNSSSTSTVSSALNNICGSAVQCDEGNIRGKLADFYSNCGAELTTSRNEDVADLYDALYTLAPLKKALCAKDDSGAYCATQNPSSTSVSSLYTETDSAGQTVFKLKPDGFKTSNLAFLFLNSATDSTKLCNSCTRSILTAYVSFESNAPYASGLGQSPILGGQSDLYNAVVSGCGANFLQGAVQAAGSLSDGIISSSDARRSVGAQAGGLVALLGAATVVAAFAF
ncbi:unnamed protein product [Somion occarium]|uniref:DUF7729 domain-containing protein n=1 Tax=Somion occarium TaxID=3059160 RepID=A0ABP1CU71_9APHY